ncbi:MAG TPA: extracellular solute-binding protein [Xanthobacteraceae bacterium]|jgi:iron(III) transport system substrate-binding protein|nr:extracellular solute-binding protein [Xanthobacteraceae bacterium]
MRDWYPQIKRLLALASLLAALPCPAFAQAAALTGAEAASYAEPGRTEKLVAGAKKAGVVTVYTSANLEDMATLADAFEKKYGVKVRVWRASSEQVVQRGVAEARGGRFDADVFETGGAAMESLHREKLLQAVKSPALDDLNPAALTSHGEWTGTRFNVFVAAYNTRLIRKDELPKSYDDLLAPRWKGKLGIEADDSDWFGALMDQMGEERGLKLFRSIAATNGISVRKGHTLLANLIVSGEVPFAITTYAYRVAQLKKSGAPVDWFGLPPVIARFEGVGVARRAPHPEAAVLFFDFMLTDAQELLRNREYFPAAREGRPLPDGISVSFLDPVKDLDESRKWSRAYRDIIINQAR